MYFIQIFCMLNWRVLFCGIFQKWSFLKIFIPSGKHKCSSCVSSFQTKEFYVTYIKRRTADHEISEFSSFFLFKIFFYRMYSYHDFLFLISSQTLTNSPPFQLQAFFLSLSKTDTWKIEQNKTKQKANKKEKLRKHIYMRYIRNFLLLLLYYVI